MPGTLRYIFADQCSLKIATLTGSNKQEDVILLTEVKQEATHVKHHKKKLVFFFSLLRHFAEILQIAGYTVRYVAYDDPHNTGSFTTELSRALAATGLQDVVVTWPGDYRVYQECLAWKTQFTATVTMLPDTRFYCDLDTFSTWFLGYKAPRMELFYRMLRKKTGILMENNQPIGGRWNYDSNNRKPPKSGLIIPPPYVCLPDEKTRAVIALVDAHFPSHFGSTAGFHFAVTVADAEKVLAHFIKERLPLFGTYQDAMVENEPWLFHAHIGMYLNTGLLHPQTCIEAAVDAYHQGQCSIAACEGFVRQILGWREYIRGLYWHHMPGYKNHNALEATRPLPDFFWTGNTDLNCLKQCITDTQTNAYAHHIQRLMVIGNFSVLAGLDPKQVSDWFLAVYADAIEWVELPNVLGMALYADGGILASKPYVSSGSYIHKMSTYCKGCRYNVKEKTGPNACPFNGMYWSFLHKHQAHFKNNTRMQMMLRLLAKLPLETLEAMRSDCQIYWDTLS